jgi:group II intron reverse transcriptase/maturase
MLLTDRKATARLLYELLRSIHLSYPRFAWVNHTRLIDMYQSTTRRDHSMAGKGDLGDDYPEAVSRVNHDRIVEWVIRESENCTGRWTAAIQSKIRADYSNTFGFDEGAPANRVVTPYSVGEGSEGQLTRSTRTSAPKEEVPFEHIATSVNHLTSYLGTTNTSLVGWGRGPIIPAEGRGLRAALSMARLYSTKSESATPLQSSNKAVDRLKTLWKGNANDPEFINKGLWQLLKDMDLWIASYKKLARSPGSMTPSIDQLTIDGTSLESLTALRDSVLNQSFVFGITKRVLIPKPGKKELRPLGIPSFQDRLVQEVFRSILEVIYEPIFSNHSHGFRPNRSQHTALRHIRAQFNGFTWCVEGDISKFFDSMDHQVMIKLMSKKISDRKFLYFISKMLKTKVMVQDPKHDNSKVITNFVGSPQGSIISPILSNIMLHDFDKFIQDYIGKYNKGTSKKRNNEYDKLYRKGGAKLARTVKYADPFDVKFKRMGYVRFADDFIISIDGPRDDAVLIKNDCAKFLAEHLKLTLNEDKTLISRHTDRIGFLSYIICKSVAKPYEYKRRYHGIEKTVKVLRGNRVYLKADLKKVITRLSQKGYCDGGGSPLPNFAHLQEPQGTAIQKVSWILNGLASYYHLAENKRHFVSKINYILRFSLAKLFAAKFKLQSMAKVFAIAGKDLSIPIKTKTNSIGVTDQELEDNIPSKMRKTERKIKGVPFTKYKDIKRPDIKPLAKDFNRRITFGDSGDSTLPDPLISLNWRTSRGTLALNSICAICGSDKRIEMHHIRGLKYIKGKTLVELMMMKAKRKQIPLCRTHHLEAHKRGLKLTGASKPKHVKFS